MDDETLRKSVKKIEKLQKNQVLDEIDEVIDSIDLQAYKIWGFMTKNKDKVDLDPIEDVTERLYSDIIKLIRIYKAVYSWF